MAHGLPDWYRGVDIAYQALAQMITRPTYGGAVRTYGLATTLPNDELVFTAITGKGMVYGGYVRFDHTASQKNSKVRLYLDGNMVLDRSFYNMDKYNFIYPGAYPLVKGVYDDTNFVYSALIAYGMTFETSISLAYDEQHGETFNLYWGIVYALV